MSLGFAVSLFGSSLKNTVQVFFIPMSVSFGELRGTFALATTAFAITYAIAAPLSGVFAERFGPSRVLHAGVLLGGSALVLCANVQSFWVFVLAYGILAAFAYTMLSYVPTGIFADALFGERRKGFFYALLTNGTAGGFIVLVPLWTWLGRYFIWQDVLTGLGAFLIIVMSPVTLYLSRRAGDRKNIAGKPLGNVRNRLGTVLGSSVFWRLSGAFFACGASMAFIDAELVPYLSGMKINAAVTSGGLAVLGICEIVGSLAAGRLCDRGMIKQVLISGYALRAVSLFVIAFRPDDLSVLTFSVIFGVSYLMTVVATSVWLLRLLPAGVKGLAIGLMWTVHQIGAAASMLIGGYVFDNYNTYVPSIIGIGIVAVAAVFVVCTVPAPRGDQVQARDLDTVPS